MHEVTRSRKLSARHMRQIEGEMTARRDAEEQLKVLVDSSPAAIITTSSDGTVLLANDAANRLFGLEPGTLPGLPIRNYLPSLINVPALDCNRQAFRTAMQCRGRRADGEVFQADVWFSTYVTSAGPRLAAMVLDTSEDLRTHEESAFHQMLTSSRILVAAVSHEVRNVCGAIALVHENLARSGKLKENKDFESLGTLVLALERIAAMDLRQTASHAARGRGAVPARRAAHRHRVFSARERSDQPVGDRRRSAYRVGGPSKPDAGLPQPDQEQRARHGGTRAEGIDRERPPRGLGSRHSFPRYRRRGRPPGAPLPSLSAGCPIDRAGPLSLARFDAQL